MNRTLRIAILERFDTQSDFAIELKEHESRVSQILNGRRKLTPSQAAIWIKTLNCNPDLLKSVTTEG